MAEIPVQKKSMPVWAWVLIAVGVLGVAGLILGLVLRNDEPTPATKAAPMSAAPRSTTPSLVKSGPSPAPATYRIAASLASSSRS